VHPNEPVTSKFTDSFAGELAPTSVPRFAPEDTAIVLTLHVKGKMEGKLKLSALDADDLGVISAAIQDSLVAVRDCAYFAGEKRFVLLLNRFRWEADAAIETAYWRTHSALVFNEVNAVHHHKIPLDKPDRVLDLLSVALENAGSAVLRFAADRTIRLEIGRLACHLGDVGEPWPTPWKPAHPAA